MLKHKLFLTIIIMVLLIPSLAQSESTITIPVPDQVANEAKNLTLTITVPTELERVERPTREMKIKKKNTHYRKYFDLNPFPPLVNPSDPDIVVRFGKLSSKDPSLRTLLKTRNMTNAYEISRNIAHITKDLLDQTVDELVSKGMTRGAINEFITVYDNYPRQLRIMGTGRKEREQMVKLSRKMAFTDGEVKIVKVETNDIGATVIQLTIAGDEDRYRPDYVSKLQKGNIKNMKMPDSSGNGSMINSDELKFEENPGSTKKDSSSQDTPPDEFIDIFE